jgi:hypothetical protein
MNSKKFTSPAGWFNLTLPENWEEYNDDVEGTSAFFNTKNWTGNLRITPIKWENLEDPNEDKAAKYLAQELKNNENSTRIKIGDFECAHYRKDVLQDGEDLVIYYWITGKKNIVFICSFTIDKKQELTLENEAEIRLVQNIIKSIKIN